MAASSSVSLSRFSALAFAALLIAAPLLWIWWSLAAASDAAEAVRVQTDTLAALRERLSALAEGAGSEQALADAQSLFLPGETAAIAGAALQRTVEDTVEAAGGELTQSEIVPTEASAEDTGRLSLRASFDADIVGLQRVLYSLETGVPILMLEDLSLQASDARDVDETESPKLRVEMQVGAHWDASQ